MLGNDVEEKYFIFTWKCAQSQLWNPLLCPISSLYRVHPRHGVSSESCPHLPICLWLSQLRPVGSCHHYYCPFILLSALFCEINYMGSLLARLDSLGLEIRSLGDCLGSYEANEMENAGRGLNYSRPHGKDPECNDRCAGSLPCSTSPLLVKCLLIHKV